MRKKKMVIIVATIALVISIGVTTAFAMSNSEGFPTDSEQNAEMPIQPSEQPIQKTVENGIPHSWFKSNRPDITDEQKADIHAKISERLEQGLAEGVISQELYSLIITAIEDGQMPEFTDAQIAEIHAMIGEFAQDFMSGKSSWERRGVERPEITDEQRAKMQERLNRFFTEDFSSERFPHGYRGGERSTMTDEQRAEMQEKISGFAQGFPKGIFSQEFFDEIRSAMENDEIPAGMRGFRRSGGR